MPTSTTQHIPEELIEEWRAIPWYNWRYEVSSIWRVRSYAKYPEWRILKPEISKLWRVFATLSRDKKAKSTGVHRFVGLAFIPNPDWKPQINHIDGNPLNNNVTNLEWCTWSENQAHRFTTLGHRAWNEKPVIQHFPDWTTKEYCSASDAGRQVWKHGVQISAVCRWERTQTGWFRWSYK